ncbi:MAG: 50S ribosomal protein L14e [Candidatus Thorarchaeota archaeon]|nr:MAG: 50S ribosomal protein L14e [Candidatus Thorarchaeota archaeon]
MKLYEIGRVCVKTMGREAGSYCVIIDVFEDNDSFVKVTGPKNITSVRRRKCNIRHLEPLKTVISIKEDASDEDVQKALDEAGLLEQVRTKIRIPE